MPKRAKSSAQFPTQLAAFALTLLLSVLAFGAAYGALVARVSHNAERIQRQEDQHRSLRERLNDVERRLARDYESRNQR